jgi:tetratricopeptide (TPR) repeat protein
MTVVKDQTTWLEAFQTAEGLTTKSSAIDFLKVIAALEKTSPAKALATAGVAVCVHPLPNVYWALASLCLRANNREAWQQVLTQAFEAIAFTEENYQGNLKLATMAFDQADMPLAVKMFEKIARLYSKNSHAQMNLAFVLKEAHQFKRSELIYRSVLKSKPNEYNITWNFSHLLLLIGKYKEGLLHYETRWHAKGFPSAKRDFKQPQWTGKKQKIRLLVHAEQGFGDTIQAARYLHLAQSRVDHLILEVQKELLPLFQESVQYLKLNPAALQWVKQGDPLPEFDAHLPFMSLPLALGLHDLGNPPLQTAYLTTAPLINRVLEKHTIQPKFVGLVWKGRPTHPHDVRRSFKLQELEILLSTPGVRFFSFQQRVTATEREILEKYKVVDLENKLTTFKETAGLMRGMDLMICTDTAVAHTSAAMGVPTWVGLAACPDWRWGVEGELTPWYAQVRLWRQGPDRVWAHVFERMTHQLIETVADWMLEKKWLPKQN